MFSWRLFHKAVVPPVLPANVLTILKAMTNLFDKSCLHQWLRTHCSEVSSGITSIHTYCMDLVVSLIYLDRIMVTTINIYLSRVLHKAKSVLESEFRGLTFLFPDH
jgi:hypothetical protein